MEVSKSLGIEEMFLIKNEKIDFIGAIVKMKENETGVRGRVKFPNGQIMFFHDQSANRSHLKDRLLSLCQVVSDFYAAPITHLEFPLAIECNEITLLLTNSKYMMN